MLMQTSVRGRVFVGTRGITTPAPTLASARTTAAHVSASVHATTSVYDNLHKWLIEEKALPKQSVEVRQVEDADIGAAVGCCATQDKQANEVLCQIPQDLAITAVDAAQHPLVGPVAEGRGELVSLTLWLLAARAGQTSERAFIDTLPDKSNTPILWDDSFRKNELRGSPLLEEARERERALQEQWRTVAAAIAAAASSGAFDPAFFNERAFLEAFTVVLAHALYLPAARCFALLPLVSHMRRTGNGDGCDVDYDPESESVVVRGPRQFAGGQQVMLNDPRPNGELLLATGAMQLENASDYLIYTTELVKTDRLYSAKRQVLEAMDMQDTETFPLYIDRFPIQLLAFLRMSRIQDVAELATVSFDRDSVVSQQNEYEVLMLVMADVRERLQEYLDNQEEDLKVLQQQDLSTEQRLATMVRCAEKRILLATTDAVRTRLAPIRGIPTKTGKLEDPNQDLLDIFQTIESVPAAPKKLWSTFSRWAKGEDDPEFRR